MLQPGQSETISLTIDAGALASFDTDVTSWIADAGNYTVKVGASSTNIKQTADFSLAKSIVVEKCNKVLVPQVSITELKK